MERRKKNAFRSEALGEEVSGLWGTRRQEDPKRVPCLFSSAKQKLFFSPFPSGSAIRDSPSGCGFELWGVGVMASELWRVVLALATHGTDVLLRMQHYCATVV